MFRLKFIATFVILLAALAGVMLYGIQTKLLPMILEDTDISLMRSASLVEKSHRIDEYALKTNAALVDQRRALSRAMTADYECDRDRLRHREVHKQLEVNEIIFDRRAQTDAVQGTRNLDLELEDRRPLDHDLFMAIDDTGRLAATLGSGLTSVFGDNVAAEFPIIHDAMERDEVLVDMWNWSWRSSDDRELYMVAIAPMHDTETNEVVGAVILGNRMADSVAQRRRSLIADGLGSEADRRLSSREEIQAPDVTFFRGDRIYSSTLRSQDQSELHRELYEVHDILAQDQSEKILSASIADQNYRVIVRFFPGQFETDNPAGIALITSSDEATAPLKAVQKNILFATIVLLILGLGIFTFYFQRFLAPFGRLEEGIQTIISGDKDYVFEHQGEHSVAQNMVHHLNLLSAYLQGKPMPDEEQSLGGWGGLDGDTAASDADKPKAIAGVPMGLGGRRKKKKDDKDGEVAAAESKGQGEEDAQASEEETS